MSIPAWILEIVGAVMLLVAEVSAGQLLAARAWTRGGGPGSNPGSNPGNGIAVSRLLMGIAMASVLVPFRTLPNVAWAAAFAVMTAWFAWCLWRESRGRGATTVASGPYAPPLVYSSAMLYLFAGLPAPSVAASAAAASGTGGMAGMPGMANMSSGGAGGLPASTLALVFALLLIACAVRDLDRRAGAGDYFRVPGGRLAPGGPALAGPGPLVRGQSAFAGAEHLLLSPAVAKGCQVTTGVTIAFILIILL